MARELSGPKCRLCRREGAKLFLKGSRCFSEKCAMLRHPQSPGQHGAKRYRGRTSSYGQHLREKQKVKRIYNISERQFRRYYKEAEKKPGVTGSYLLQILERRLDNVVYRLGLASSRKQARQRILQKKYSLNGISIYTPSILVSAGDLISLKNEKGVFIVEDREIPAWLSYDKKKKEGKVLNLPERDDIDAEIDEQLIVEFYSL